MGKTCGLISSFSSLRKYTRQKMAAGKPGRPGDAERTADTSGPSEQSAGAKNPDEQREAGPGQAGW